MTTFAGDGTTDDAPALQQAVDALATAGGGVLRLPYTPQGYGLRGLVLMRQGVWIEGETPATRLLALAGHPNGKLLKWANVQGGGARDLTIDGGLGAVPRNHAMSVSGCERVTLEGITGRNLVSLARLDAGSRRCTVIRPDVEGADSNAVELVDVTFCDVLHAWANASRGFGIFLDGSTSRCLIAFPACERSGRELVGATANTRLNRIIGWHAEGTGDNGLSVTGDYNVTAGGVSYRNAFSGLHLYGEHTAAVGCVAASNGQAGIASRAYGIRAVSGFGGQGAFDALVGNATGDDQAAPTQLVGVYATAGLGNVVADNA